MSVYLPPFNFPSTLAALALTGMCAVAAGATVTVAVTDKDGAPVTDAVVYLEGATGRLPSKPATGAEISQSKRQFQPRVLVVPVGTAVAFPNMDTVRHQVYSFSPAKIFELKLYAGVPGEPVTFDKPGTAVLGCNIHDKMSAWVHVVDSPYYAKTEANGEAKLLQVPPGNYKLMAWHPAMPANTAPQQLALTVAKADMDSPVKLSVGAQALP
ncbi:methylamine utilization protein [soil metagenome]